MAAFERLRRRHFGCHKFFPRSRSGSTYFRHVLVLQTGSEQYCTSGKCGARQGICSILKSHLGREVCGEAVDGRQAVRMVKDLKPQIVILESAMPMLSGLEIPSEPVNRVLGQTRTAVLEKKGSCYLLAHGG